MLCFFIIIYIYLYWPVPISSIVRRNNPIPNPICSSFSITTREALVIICTSRAETTPAQSWGGGEKYEERNNGEERKNSYI